MNSGNPALSAQTFEQFKAASRASATMTVDGSVNKTGLLFLLAVLTGGFTWFLFLGQNPVVPALMLGGLVVGLLLALVTIFKKEWAPITAPLYALAEGFALGGVSAFFDAAYGGIVFQAVFLTFGVLALMLVLYKTRVIQVTDQLRLGIVAATGAIALIYVASFVLGFFGVSVPFIHEGGLFGIAFSLIVVGIAALNLVLDFDFIDQGAHSGAPKFMEWYAAFALMVTLVWLYLEILRLLGKMRSND